MRTNLLLFSLFASIMLASSAVAQNRADSTFIDASVETYTPNFEKVSPQFEQFVEQLRQKKFAQKLLRKSRHWNRIVQKQFYAHRH